MKKQIYEKSVQNARIDLDLSANEAKFGYPVKRYSRIKEFFHVMATLWCFYVFPLGITFIVYALYLSFTTPIASYSFEVQVGYLLNIGLAFFILFGPPSIASFIMVFFKRSLLRFFPKLNFIILKMVFPKRFYMARFENIRRKTIEIPLFHNVILDYKATGEFAHHLKRIRVREHPFMEVVRDSKGGTVSPNESLWKAVFIFSKVPKSGMLEAYFM